MTGREMAEWEVYSLLEPFGWPADEMIMAGIRHSALAPYLIKGAKSEVNDYTFDFCGVTKKNRMVGPKEFMTGLKGLARKKKGD